ncbi:ankyrin repeat domain-containing protein [Rhodanobacter sp. L36]|uniref:ankyrin repeat domain-containing protein n=1 Tax=Rhodanobacter sp. L36 TaxID=1747221 RepID=UPI00131BFA05|nr:ankyrin repeat domain-containing protein [Rhodanobacter sp. L36]
MPPSPSTGTPAQQSKYALDRIYKDPKAQALALAAEQGNAAEVQRLMKQEHVNPDVIFADDESGMPLVAWPVFTLNATGLKALLDNGANPNARKPGTHRRHYKDGSQGDIHFNYDNAMVWAAKQDDPIYLKLLLDHGGDPNTRNCNDETLLFQAYIWHRQWQNVQVLVERGADVNAVTGVGTILFDFSSSGGFEQSYWLLQHGADPTIDAYIPPPQPAPPRHRIIEDIFWYPTDPKNSSHISWQRKCQQWLLQRGFKRPPLPDDYRDMRKTFGLPYEEKDIPLL